MEKNELDTVKGKADDIHKEIGWKCPVDRTSVNALCQLHEVYVDEKRWCTDEAVCVGVGKDVGGTELL